MRVHPRIVLVALAVWAAPAWAQGVPRGFDRQAAADPDATVERLAAALSREPRGSGHDRPSRGRASVRDVMKAGATRDAYAWLDNR